MPNILFLDIETYSELPLKKCGAHRYAEAAEVIIVQTAWDDQLVDVWDLTDGTHGAWQAALQFAIDEADTVVIHNSQFERSVLRHHGVVIPVEKIEDTMVLALQHGLPGSLDMLCDILNVPRDKAKDKDGKKLINRFCKPQAKNVKLRRATQETHPDEWRAFLEYARLDVDAMRELYRRLPRWNATPRERTLWQLDQRINDRGFAVDLELAHAALRAFDRTGRTLAARVGEITGGEVTSATQRDKFLTYVQARGVPLTDVTKDTVAAALRGDLEPDVRELLTIRQQASATSPAKYRTLLDATGTDGRLRGSVQFCGAARSGRDAGRLFQPQNLPRPSAEFDAIETAIEAMKLGCEDLLYDNVSEICVNAVRGSLVAEPGSKLAIADLKNIEGRVVAWLAGEEWKLRAFREYDAGTGPDLYVAAYARAFGVSVDAVLDNYENGDKSMRQIGKVMELALGFQGGVGAFTTMGGETAEALGEAVILEIVKAWRKAHPAIRSYWYDCEAAAKQAIRNPGEQFAVRDTVFDVVDDAFGIRWLRVLPPSGRYLCYMDPRLDDHRCSTCNGSGNVLIGGFIEDQPSEPLARKAVCPTCDGVGTWGTGHILHEGLNQYTKKWGTRETYGGSLVENFTQHVARDVFMAGLRAAEEAGYPVVLRVHDELVTEVPDTGDFSHEKLADMMATNPPWAVALPLAAAGFETHRYRKD